MPDDEDARLVRAAAANNAALCAAVSRSHGLTGGFEPDAWTCSVRTPPLYPDAVTLTATVDVASLLARIDAGPGASVKDSFASLDLADVGFRVLFSAEWVARPPAPAGDVDAATDVHWSPVADARLLAEWEAAWSDDGSSRGRFQPALLAEPDFVVLRADRDDATVAGAIANRTDAVVGVSNLFATGISLADAWAGCLDAISARLPECAVVGYESGSMVDAAHDAGFRSLGPLHVWIKD